MTEERLVLAELLEKASEGDFLRAVAEAVLQLLMETDVEGLIGAGRYERNGERTTWRSGHRERTLDTRFGALQLRIPIAAKPALAESGGQLFPAVSGSSQELGEGADRGHSGGLDRRRRGRHGGTVTAEGTASYIIAATIPYTCAAANGITCCRDV